MFFYVYALEKKECKDGFLGILWWVIDPLIYMVAFYAIFALGLRGKGTEFAPFLLCGLVPWKWFASSINRATVSIKKNSQLIKQVYLPKYVFPSVEIVRGGFKFLISFFVLVLFLFFYKGCLIDLFYIVPVFIAQMFFIFSLGMLLSSFYPFLPDIKLVVENMIMFLFFVSGIFFDIDKFSPEVRQIFMLNPMAILIKAFRRVLLDNDFPDVGQLLYVFLLSLILFIAALCILKRFDRFYSKIV
ncbi:ABC transporter permease [Geothermobacter ehrlichii]|nr:ABC transporter permease [Geothermobacter ehrlichii]